MSEKETVQERLARMKQEAAGTTAKESTDLVSQLTHEGSGAPDFAEIAKKLEERKEQEPKGENVDHVKMTIYVREDLAQSFSALCTKRGQQKEFINQAIADFILKKARELGIDK